MTPIKIEPNSGVKMAGVKIQCPNPTGPQQWFEIICVGTDKLFGKNQSGYESAVHFDYVEGWLLYEEPKAEVSKIDIYEEALWRIKDLKPTDSVREAFAIAGEALKRGNEL